MIRMALLQSGRVDWLWLLLLAGTILVPACSNSLEDHPPLYPVKGKVILDGKPMTERNNHFRVLRRWRRCSQRCWGRTISSHRQDQGWYL